MGFCRQGFLGSFNLCRTHPLTLTDAPVLNKEFPEPIYSGSRLGLTRLALWFISLKCVCAYTCTVHARDCRRLCGYSKSPVPGLTSGRISCRGRIASCEALKYQVENICVSGRGATLSEVLGASLKRELRWHWPEGAATAKPPVWLQLLLCEGTAVGCTQAGLLESSGPCRQGGSPWGGLRAM